MSMHQPQIVDINENQPPSRNIGKPALEPERKKQESSCSVLLIDHRALERDCLARSLEAVDSRLNVTCTASLEDWMRNDQEPPAVTVYVIGGKSLDDMGIRGNIRKICECLPDSPLIIVSDTDELGHMMKALELGARGYIPSSVGIAVATEAIGLARAGGVFLPASGVLAKRQLIENIVANTERPDSVFTRREAQVADALRRGKLNKTIAYELNLCESTVKVHIRNIMKKLKATNRTEVAYKLQEFRSRPLD